MCEWYNGGSIHFDGVASRFNCLHQSRGSKETMSTMVTFRGKYPDPMCTEARICQFT